MRDCRENGFTLNEGIAKLYERFMKTVHKDCCRLAICYLGTGWRPQSLDVSRGEVDINSVVVGHPRSTVESGSSVCWARTRPMQKGHISNFVSYTPYVHTEILERDYYIKHRSSGIDGEN